MEKLCWNCHNLLIFDDNYPFILYCPKTYTNPSRTDKPKDHPHCEWKQNTTRR